MERFWMVIVEGTPSTRHRHITELEAINESHRLADMPSNLGKKVYILEAIGFSQTPSFRSVFTALEK